MGTTVGSKLDELLSRTLPPGHLRALLLFLGPLRNREITSLTDGELDECSRWVAQALRHSTSVGPIDPVLHGVVGSLARERAAPRSSSNDRLPTLAQCSPAATAVRAIQTASASPPLESVVSIVNVEDVVQARMKAKLMAIQLGFTDPAAVRIATAVSELARNIIFYAKVGDLQMNPLVAPASPRTGMRIVAVDHGPGIENLELVLSGKYKSKRGLGLGLRGVRQLMDEMTIETGAGRGTTITAMKWLS